LPQNMTWQEIPAQPHSPEPANGEQKHPGLGLSNRSLALSVLAFMGLVALLFLGYALQTQQIRREHDLSLPKSQSITIPISIAIACNVYIVALIFAMVRPQHRPGAMRLTILLAGITTVVVTVGLLRVHIRVSSDPNSAEDIGVQSMARAARAAELPALGFLPSDTNVIAAIQVAELMETPAGQEFLAASGPANLWNGQQFQNWTGLELRDIEYIVIGLKIDENLLPRLTLIIETLRPISVSSVQDHLKGSKLPDPEAVRFPSSHTLILGLTKKDLQLVPAKPTNGIDHLIEPLRTVMNEKIARGSQVWMAGYSADWEKTLALTFLDTLPKEDRDVLKGVQSFAVGLRVDGSVSMQASFQCFNESTAKGLADLIQKHSRDELKGLKFDQKGNWISIQANAADISSLVNKMKAPKAGR
jgi:hypothetical protein